jgi:hypothetical protein
MFSMLTEISVVPFDRQMGQTHPEQHGSPAWTYISTILFGIHNSFVEDRYCFWSFICWFLILSLIQGQEKQTQSSRWGKYATECHLKLRLSAFLQVYSADSSLFLYADSKVSTVTCSLSRLESPSIGDRPNFPFQYGLSWPHPDEDWRPCISFKAVKWRCKLLLSLTCCALLFFLSQTRGFQFLQTCLHHHYAFPPFQFQYAAAWSGKLKFGTGP